MRTKLLLTVCGFILSCSTFSAFAQDSIELSTEKQKFSYVVGFQIGQRLKSDNMDLDPKVVALAVEHVLSGSSPKLSPEQMQAVVQSYQQEQMEERVALAAANQTAGDEYLAENKSKEGVVELPSGLQYKEVNAGEGKKPQTGDTVLVHYRGTLLNGEEFDSSYGRGEPAAIPLEGVIPGWQEALQLMSEGAKWEVFIPGNLAYGEQGAGASIGPNETLIFEIELLEVQ